MKRRTVRKLALLLLFLMTALVGIGQAGAAALDPARLTTDLNNLVLQGNDLVALMSTLTITTADMSTQLTTIETPVNAYVTAVGTVYKDVSGAVGTTTFSVSSDMLNALQNLATIQASLASELLDLSGQIANLSAGTTATVLQSSLTAMLRLSDDIGVMADRILEMADKILIMADNIGLMADRILATQVTQNTNIELTIDAILQTQQNTILLIAVLLG